MVPSLPHHYTILPLHPLTLIASRRPHVARPAGAARGQRASCPAADHWKGRVLQYIQEGTLLNISNLFCLIE